MPSERRLYPLHVLAWRLLWWLPVQAARILLTLCVLCAFGRDAARSTWELSL